MKWERSGLGGGEVEEFGDWYAEVDAMDKVLLFCSEEMDELGDVVVMRLGFVWELSKIYDMWYSWWEDVGFWLEIWMVKGVLFELVGDWL